VGAVGLASAPATQLADIRDQYRDFDYIVTGPPGTTTQVYRWDPNDDIGLQDSTTSLRKRIYRRIFGSPGDYSWDGEYGVGVSVQALARGGRLQELASSVAEQVRREPDVADASCEARVERRETGSFVVLDLAVVRRDRSSVQLGLQQPL
jgi:hypothetical protein